MKMWKTVFRTGVSRWYHERPERCANWRPTDFAGPLITAREAMERDVVEAWTPSVVEGRTPLDQPMALASARRA